MENFRGGEKTRVYSSPDRMLVDTFRRVLSSYGIASDARDAFPTRVKGRIPISELWVLDTAKADRARNIIAQAEKKNLQSAVRWKCGECGELTEGPFDRCWQCGNPRR